MVVRNEDKFRTRNKSQRSVIETALFRPETVAMMAAARDRLSFATLGTDFLDLKTMKRAASATDTTLCLHSDVLPKAICNDPSTRAIPNDPSAKAIPNDPSARAIPNDPLAKAIPNDPLAKAIPNDPTTNTIQKTVYLEGDVGDGE